MPDITAEALARLSESHRLDALARQSPAGDLPLDPQAKQWLDLASDRQLARASARDGRKLHMLYQRLAAKLAANHEECAAVQLAGCEGGEGASTLARDMAGAIAVWYHRPVWLLSGNAPKRAARFAAAMEDAARSAPVASEPVCTTPPDILLETFGTELLGRFRRRFGAVIVDGDPILGPGNGVPLAARCDCTLLVIEAERTSRESAEAAIRHVHDVGGRIGGVILNKRRLHGPRWLRSWLLGRGSWR